MREFRSLAIVSRPPLVVWTTVRDRLADLLPFLTDIESVTTHDRLTRPDGTVQLVNTWKARPKVPAALRSIVGPDAFTWEDHAEWRSASRECHWSVRVPALSNDTPCSGVTRYDEALGGRGTRLTFEGTFQVPPGARRRLPGPVLTALAAPAESFITTMIVSNFQKLARALEQHVKAAP